MEQKQTPSLWYKIKELMSKIKTLLVKKIENWTKELDKKITIANSSNKEQSPARVLDTGESNVNNQSEQHENIEENQVPTPPPATVINKTNVSLGLGNILFWGLIIYAFFSVPDKTDHAEAIIKTIPLNEIYDKKPEAILLDENKVHAALKAAILENFEVENYYLFSVCHKKCGDYEFPNDILDGNFISFGILGKVFPRQEMIEKKIKENIEKEQRNSLQSSNTGGHHGSEGDNTFDRDNYSEHGNRLEIVTNAQQFGDEIETYPSGCDYQVTHTVVVANRSDRDVAAQDYYLSVSPVSSDEYDYSETNTSYVSGKFIPAHGTATFTWTDMHFDGTWTYEDRVELIVLS